MSQDYGFYDVITAHLDEKKEHVKIIKTRVSEYALAKGQQVLKDMRSAGVLSRSNHKTIESKYRTRKKMIDILSLNLNDRSRFVTLTYRENLQDYKKSYNDFKKMLTYFNQKNPTLKYMVVKEHQKRGAIHYHMVTFNNHKIKWRKYWSHGITHSKKITDIEFPEKIANYMTKYLTKNEEGYKSIPVGFRAFGSSRNLIKKKKIYITEKEYNELPKLVYKMSNIDNNGSYRTIESVTDKKVFKKNVLPF